MHFNWEPEERLVAFQFHHMSQAVNDGIQVSFAVNYLPVAQVYSVLLQASGLRRGLYAKILNLRRYAKALRELNLYGGTHCKPSTLTDQQLHHHPPPRFSTVTSKCERAVQPQSWLTPNTYVPKTQHAATHPLIDSTPECRRGR